MLHKDGFKCNISTHCELQVLAIIINFTDFHHKMCTNITGTFNLCSHGFTTDLAQKLLLAMATQLNIVCYHNIRTLPCLYRIKFPRSDATATIFYFLLLKVVAIIQSW